MSAPCQIGLRNICRDVACRPDATSERPTPPFECLTAHHFGTWELKMTHEEAATCAGDRSMTVRTAIAALMDRPGFFRFFQSVIPLTPQRCQKTLREQVTVLPGERLLDLGCGVGSYHDFFDCEYCGIDDSPLYVAWASKRYPTARFLPMDAAKLDFADATFDQAMTIATTHHLPDAKVLGMVSEALRVLKPGGRLHIVDAIIPLNPRQRIKQAIFAYDRGTHQRSFAALQTLIARGFRIRHAFARSGFPHDVCYIGLSKDQQR